MNIILIWNMTKNRIGNNLEINRLLEEYEKKRKKRYNHNIYI